MEEGSETSITTTTNNGGKVATYSRLELQDPNNGKTAIFHQPYIYFDDIDSTCSTPYVSAPSSPDCASGGGSGEGFFYSAPASPIHLMMCSSSSNLTHLVSNALVPGPFEFEFLARFGTIGSSSTKSMISADELFLNNQIWLMKLSLHLQRPQVLMPLLDLDETEGDCENVTDESNKFSRGRDVKWRNRSLRRKTNSISLLRSSLFQWHESDNKD